MKTLTLFSFFAFTLLADAVFDKTLTKYGLEELWTVTDSIDTPESAYFDKNSSTFYVSNVAGKPDEKDGKGWISKITLKDGKPTVTKFVDGLNAPKGLRSYQDTLWVSDFDRVVGISLKDGAKTIVDIPGAKFLNDVAISTDGRVFVSDTLGTSIYVIQNGKASVFDQGKQLESPNGLLVDGDRLLVAAWGITTDFSTKTPGRLYAFNLKTKKKTFITKKPVGNLDGLERDENGDYIVSDWKAGTVFRLSKKGEKTMLVDGIQGAADLAYVIDTKTLVVPRMGENKVTAYRLP